MMAASKKMLDQEPSEIEMLLPFHAAGHELSVVEAV
jgi:hypothetical protein